MPFWPAILSGAIPAASSCASSQFICQILLENPGSAISNMGTCIALYLLRFWSIFIQFIRQNSYLYGRRHICTNCACALFFITWDSMNMVKIVMDSKTTSCQLDPIPTSFLKILIDILLPLLTQIINLSFEEGHVPSDLKMALDFSSKESSIRS